MRQGVADVMSCDLRDAGSQVPFTCYAVRGQRWLPISRYQQSVFRKLKAVDISFSHRVKGLIGLVAKHLCAPPFIPHGNFRFHVDEHPSYWKVSKMADFGWLRVLTPRSRTPQNEEVNLKSEPATPVDAKSPGTGTTAKAATSDSVAIPKLSALPRPAPTSKAALPSKKVESSTGAASSKASTIPKVAAKKAAAVTKGGPSTKDATPKSGSPSGVPASPRKKQEKVKVEKVKPKKGKAKESCKTGASLAPPAIVVHGPENTDNAIDTPRVRSSSSSSDESLSSSPQWGPSAPDASSQAFRSEALAATLDALRSMTMTRRPEDPIPAEYGAHLCRALEAYAALEATARRLAAALAEERQMAKDNRRDFEELADSWIVREARFRAEISRLEKLVVAAQAVQGEDSAGDGATSAKEIITLVRKNSLVRKESVQSDRYLIRLQAVLNRTCETRTGEKRWPAESIQREHRR